MSAISPSSIRAPKEDFPEPGYVKSSCVQVSGARPVAMDSRIFLVVPVGKTEFAARQIYTCLAAPVYIREFLPWRWSARIIVENLICIIEFFPSLAYGRVRHTPVTILSSVFDIFNAQDSNVGDRQFFKISISNIILFKVRYLWEKISDFRSSFLSSP